MSTPSVSVLGAGVMGDLHANVVASHRGATLASVVDLDADAAAAVAESHDATATTDVGGALDAADACIIATPEPTHADLLDRAVAADCPVLLEKPIAGESGDVEQMAGTADVATVPILPGHLLRYDPRYVEAHRAARAGELGDLLSLSARRGIPREWSERMGDRIHPVKQIGTHDVDLLRWITDAEVTRVHATATERDLTDVGVPDAVHATLTFDSGATASARFIGLWPDAFPADIDARMEIVGSDGGSLVQVPAGGVAVAAAATTTHPDVAYWPTVHGRVTGTLRTQFDHFLEVVDGATPQLSMAEAVRTFEVTDAIVDALDVDGSVDVSR